MKELKLIDDLIPKETERDYIDSRVNDIETAAQRSRWLYGLVIAISWVLIAMAFNTTLSFMRSFAESNEDTPMIRGAATAQEVVPDVEQDRGQRPQMVGRDAMRQHLLRNWVESLHFEVPVLGARFSATDAGIIGGLLLAILGSWCIYSSRRENHLIFYLLRDSEKYKTDEKFRKYLKNQLHATQLFGRSPRAMPLSVEHLSNSHAVENYPGPAELTIAKRNLDTTQFTQDLAKQINDGKQDALVQFTATEGIARDVQQSVGSAAVKEQWSSCGSVPDSAPMKISTTGRVRVAGQQKQEQVVRRWLLVGQVDWRFLRPGAFNAADNGWGSWLATIVIFYLPAVALFAVFAGDVATLFMNSPVRAEKPDETLWDALCSPNGCPDLKARLLVSFSFVIVNLVVMVKAHAYQRATNRLLAYMDQPCWTRVREPG